MGTATRTGKGQRFFTNYPSRLGEVRRRRLRNLQSDYQQIAPDRPVVHSTDHWTDWNEAATATTWDCSFPNASAMWMRGGPGLRSQA